MAATVNRIQIQDDQGNYYLPHTAADVVAFNKEGTDIQADDVAAAIKELNVAAKADIPNSRMANMPGRTVKGNTGSGAARPADLTREQLAGMLAEVPRTYKGTLTGAGLGNAITVPMPGFGRATGAIIAAEFDYVVRAPAPTLNVNGTGAAGIRSWIPTIGNFPPGVMAPGIHHLRYNGSNWIVLDGVGEKNIGTCSTASNASAKVGTLPGFVRASGSVVGLDFTSQGGSYVSPATLNVNSTGSAPVVDFRGGNVDNEGLTAGMNYFRYNGSQWELLTPVLHQASSPRAVPCSTAAATTAKTVALSGFYRFNGAVVVVDMANANTASAPTLNVNSTGSAAIRDFRTNAAPASGQLAAGINVFRFNGTHWILLTPAGADNKGTCSEAAQNTTKRATLAGFTLTTGAIVSLYIDGPNTSASPQLNVNNTGAKPIVDWQTGVAPNPMHLTVGHRVFEYNGTQWVLLNPHRHVIPEGSVISGDWAGQPAGHREQRITVSGVTSAMALVCDLDMESLAPAAPDGYEKHRAVQAEAAKIARVVSGAGSITVHTWGPDAPMETIPLILKA